MEAGSRREPPHAGSGDVAPRPLRRAVARRCILAVAGVAAGQFTREALALVRNAEFIRFCHAQGDEATARLYEETIQPEKHHHELGRHLLLDPPSPRRPRPPRATPADVSSRWRRSSRRSPG